jgi:outer membrane receptor protein involved in Fe transport
MKFFILIGFVILAYSGKLPAQSSQRPGFITILQADTRNPIQDATVYNVSKSFIRISDENGRVFLDGLSQNETALSVSCIGYATQTILLSDLTQDGAVLLVAKVSSLYEVMVSGTSRRGIFRTISDLDIHLRPINNSQEVLRMVPGLFIGQHAGGGKAEQIFLRGFDIDHGTDIQISVDGMPVNMVSHAHGQGYADLHFVIPELIEKVDFNKGPYFADKGNLATAGYVDFRSRDFLDKNFVKTEAGQFNTYRGVFGINLLSTSVNKLRRHSLYAAGEVSYTDGYFDSPQAFKRLNGILKYRGKLSDRSTLISSVSAFTSKWNASGQIPERAVKDGAIGRFGSIDDKEGGQTSRYNFNNELQTHLSSKTTWRNQLYYSRYLFTLYSNFTFFLNDPINGDQIRQREKRDLTGFNSVLIHQHKIAGLTAVLETGLQLRYDAVRHSELSRTKDRTDITNAIMYGDINELNAGSFVQERLDLRQNLSVTIGARADYFHNQYRDLLTQSDLKVRSHIISPKLNVNWKVNEAVQLYWYNGKGFHSNDTRVAVQQNGRDLVTPALGSDLGAIIRLGKKAILQTAMWYLWLQQEFVYVGDEGIVEAGGKTRRMGIDLSVRYELISGLFADADLSLARPRALGVPGAESYLPLAPRITSSGGFTYRKIRGWNGSLRYRYMGNRPANEDKSVLAEGYFICDAAINYTLPKWELGVSVQNLFNQKWKETQFDTESRLQSEPAPVSEIHFTPGAPFFARIAVSVFF